jgi:hypothetical protein
MVEMTKHTKLGVRKPVRLEEADVNGTIILKWTLKK